MNGKKNERVALCGVVYIEQYVYSRVQFVTKKCAALREPKATGTDRVRGCARSVSSPLSLSR